MRMAVRCARTLYLADNTDFHRCVEGYRSSSLQSQRETCSIQSKSAPVVATHSQHAIATTPSESGVKEQNATTRAFVSRWFSRFYETRLSCSNHIIEQYQHNENKEYIRFPALGTIFNEALERNGFETDALLSIYEQSSRGCPEHKKVDTIRLQLERDEDSLKPICGSEFNYHLDDGATQRAERILAYEGVRKKWKPCLQPN